MMPMPAETLRHSTIHSSQNCGRLVGVVEVDVVGRDHGVAVGGRRPSLGLPAGGRKAIAERADQHEHVVDRRPWR